MKILWVKSDFLHPTTRGGQIRTLEMLRRLHARHEVHYVAFANPGETEGMARSVEYASRAYPVAHRVPPRRSARFLAQLARGVYSDLPVSIERYRSERMRAAIGEITSRVAFDARVCDFLTPAVNLPDLRDVVLFQHNVETQIWERHAETAPGWLARRYLKGQASRMQAFETYVCRTVRRVVAVSSADATLLRDRFQARQVREVPTGVDLEFFARRGAAPRIADLVFVGSMDWLPNIDGVQFLVREVIPLIRRQIPECSLAIVGRQPGAEIRALAAGDPNIMVTGTVADVRPYLWGSTVSVVPLRIGGGTRLKIFEAIAARTAVVSTTIGAEGLDIASPGEFRRADTAQEFAEQCVRLLDDRAERDALVERAWNLVSGRFSWDAVTATFEAAIGEA